MWSSLSVTCDSSVSFSKYSGFHHQQNWPPPYNWNIVESGVEIKPVLVKDISDWDTRAKLYLPTSICDFNTGW